MNYRDRSQQIKAESEAAYKAAKPQQPESVRIGAKRGDTGRHQVLRSDGGATSNGDKIFNASLPNDGFVRGIVSKNVNSIPLEHRNVKRKNDVITQIQEAGTRGQIKTLYVQNNKLYIGGDRATPLEIYSLSDLFGGVNFGSFKIDATGDGENDWIVTGYYPVTVSGIDDFQRYKYITITSEETFEDYASPVALFQLNSLGSWSISLRSFKVGDEVYLSANVTIGVTQKVYVRAVTPVVNGLGSTIGYTVGYSYTPTGSVITVSGATEIRLAKVVGSIPAGFGWFGDRLFGTAFNALSGEGGAVEKGNFTLALGIVNRISTGFGNVREGDSIVFFKKTADSVLPTPLVENKSYKARNPVYSFPPQRTVFDVYDGDIYVSLSGSTSNCYVVKEAINIQNAPYDYLIQTFTQIKVPQISPTRNEPFYNCNLLRGLDVTYDLLRDPTHIIPNTGRYHYINSADLGLLSGVYFVPDYLFFNQGKDLGSQFVVKITITKTSNPLNDHIDAEYRLYTGAEYVVIGTDHIGYAPDAYPDKVFGGGIFLGLAFNNLIENRGIFSYTDYFPTQDGIANILTYELNDGTVSPSTSSASFFAIDGDGSVLWTSAYV